MPAKKKKRVELEIFTDENENEWMQIFRWREKLRKLMVIIVYAFIACLALIKVDNLESLERWDWKRRWNFNKFNLLTCTPHRDFQTIATVWGIINQLAADNE